MKPDVYYNEIDVGAQRWLRELMHEGLIPRGHIDGRPIQDVRADDLRGYGTCHFFAGIGVWAYALGCASFDLGGVTWTGSCPCQPFSVAGKGGGFDDPRHLWPHWVRLIEECRPDRILGEQSANAGAWVDLVRTDLEALDYAFGSPDLPAAGFGGAHIRPRFYWLADADNAEWWADRAPGNVGDWPHAGRVQGAGDPGDGGALRWLGDADGGLRGRGICGPGEGLSAPDGHAAQLRDRGSSPGDPAFGLGDAGQPGLSDAQFGILRRPGRWPTGRATEQPSRASGARVDWLLCRSGVFRPVEPGLAPLVTEAPARMAALRGFGNALDAEVATQFVQAYLRSLP